MILATFILMGLVTAFVLACEGDYSGLKMIGTILLYIVMGGIAIWFLAMTGWFGIILIIVVNVIIAAFSNTKK